MKENMTAMAFSLVTFGVIIFTLVYILTAPW